MAASADYLAAPMPDHTPDPAATPPHLPARLPQTTALLRRAQETLKVLRDVVEESSSTYWHEKGKRASAAERWDEAISCYDKCLRNKGDAQYYNLAYYAAAGLCEAYANRGEYRAREGDMEGSVDDEHDFHVVNEYLEWIIGMIDS